MEITVTFAGELRQHDPKVKWEDVISVADIVSRVPRLRTEPMNFVVSRNGTVCELGTKLCDGDKIFFAPMVMGG